MLDLHFKLLLDMQIQHGDVISKIVQYGKFGFALSTLEEIWCLIDNKNH